MCASTRATVCLLVSDFVGRTLSRVTLGGALLDTRSVAGGPKGLRLSPVGDLFAALQTVDLVATYDSTTGLGSAAEHVGSRPGALDLGARPEREPGPRRGEPG